MLAIELPPDVESRLEALAAKTDRSKEDCAREATRQLLEDREDAKIAKKHLKNTTNSWTLQDLEHRRGLVTAADPSPLRDVTSR